MPSVSRAIKIFVIFLVVIGAAIWITYRVAADEPGRQMTIVIPYIEYEYWLLSWQENEVECRVVIDHEGLPTSQDVLKSCGEGVQTEWLNTPSCNKIIKGKGKISSCPGLYLILISSQPKEKEITIDLPQASVGVNLEGCSPVPPENLCEKLPALLLTGEEPLPNEQITSIEGTINGVPFNCKGATCPVKLTITSDIGVTVEFWANSTFGDSSPRYTAQVRVIDAGVSLVPGGGGFHIDVLSSQWKGGPLASCSRTWETFPPVGGTVDWLRSPNQPALLVSDEAYYYLAGRLIAQGVVDASKCPSLGLLPNGYANACGLEVAAPIVMAWQNQFDARIIQVSKETGVPAQLLKNLFAQESQFWPGMFKVPFEFGLGQITDKGADTILLWNTDFYETFCPLVLSKKACDNGYLKLQVDDQAMLRGALAQQAKSDCPLCPAGVDLTSANSSISLFANTLLSSCDQVAQIVHNATGEKPGAVSSYEDLWRFTIANYHAGPGCLSYAIYATWAANGQELLWDEVTTQFTEACKGVIPYVDKIAR